MLRESERCWLDVDRCPEPDNQGIAGWPGELDSVSTMPQRDEPNAAAIRIAVVHSPSTEQRRAQLRLDPLQGPK